MERKRGVVAERIGASEAKAHFSELLARAGYSGERFLVERRGKPLAALVGAEDLKRLEGEDPAGSRPRGAMSLVGAWGDLVNDAEIDVMLEDLYAAREEDLGRRVDLDGSA